jgi:nicotinamidase-related amidase
MPMFSSQWSPAHNPDVVLVVVDMQEAFAQATPWQVPDLGALLKPIERLAAAFGPRRIFTRFVYRDPARWPGDAWREYYRRWTFLQGRADLEAIVAPLRPLATAVVDKPGYSCAAEPAFIRAVAALGGRRLVFAGVETDVCVLASAFGAIDHGWPCAVVSDACASGSRQAHDAALQILGRLPEQVALLRTDQLAPEGAADGQA